MSWGSGAAAKAGEGASSAAPAASAAGSGSGASGFSLQSPNYTGEAMPASAADGTSVSMTDAQVADTANYGTSNPTFMDKAVGTLDRFQKGGDASLAQAWKDRGVNAQTAGYLYNKVNAMGGAGKTAPASPINTTINYQQPTNPYLAKRGRY